MDARQNIINSLMQYLPQIATSLGSMVEYLGHIIDPDSRGDSSERKSDIMQSLVPDIGNVLSVMEPFIGVQSHEGATTQEDIEIVQLHRKSINLIVNGLRQLLQWMSDTASSDDMLHDAVNNLFEGSQTVARLVEILTKA